MLSRRALALALSAALAATALAAPATARPGGHHGDEEDVRFATFNASLNRNTEGQLITDLSTPDNAQAAAVAEVVQRARPDVVLINEFDFDAGHQALNLFRDNYLEVGHNGAPPVDYPFAYTAPVNTGVPSGKDLNNNGVVAGGDDAFGFGLFPGQYGLAVYSKYPIDVGHIRTFQKFLWKDLPGANLPDDPGTPAAQDWYSPDELAIFRLSSKSHWDLPLRIGKKTVHFLVSHPTPPVFDGPEDRNGTRNFDEIRFWGDYITGGGQASYIYDDKGDRGGLDRSAGSGARFVIAGDQNSDPLDGDSLPGSIQNLLDNPRVNTSHPPTSLGGPEASVLQGGANVGQQTPSKYDTADFADNSPGNIRADYVLPSRGIRITDSAVFWPTTTDPLFRLTGVFPFPTSDHRLVWVDTRF